MHTYANTIPTPQGGTHEAGFLRRAVKGLRAYGDLKKEKRSAAVTAEDLIVGLAWDVLSVFVRNPQFPGQPRTS